MAIDISTLNLEDLLWLMGNKNSTKHTCIVDEVIRRMSIRDEAIRLVAVRLYPPDGASLVLRKDGSLCVKAMTDSPRYFSHGEQIL